MGPGRRAMSAGVAALLLSGCGGISSPEAALRRELAAARAELRQAREAAREYAANDLDSRVGRVLIALHADAQP